MKKRKTEKPPVQPYVLMSLCDRCADTYRATIQDKGGDVTRRGSPYHFTCAFCWKPTWGYQHEIWPPTRQRRLRPSSGGGERARAGRA